MIRYKLNICHDNGTAMLPRHDGKWVKFDELATLRAENERLREALTHVAYGGNFTCFVDGSWEIVNEALK